MIIILFIAIYFLPSTVGFMRGHASKWAILLLNIFAGWTLLFWFWALVWAFANKGASNTIIINNN